MRTKGVAFLSLQGFPSPVCGARYIFRRCERTASLLSCSSSGVVVVSFGFRHSKCERNIEANRQKSFSKSSLANLLAASGFTIQSASETARQIDKRASVSERSLPNLLLLIQQFHSIYCVSSSAS